jgi:hypothetical protein
MLLNLSGMRISSSKPLIIGEHTNTKLHQDGAGAIHFNLSSVLSTIVHQLVSQCKGRLLQRTGYEYFPREAIEMTLGLRFLGREQRAKKQNSVTVHGTAATEASQAGDNAPEYNPRIPSRRCITRNACNAPL